MKLDVKPLFVHIGLLLLLAFPLFSHCQSSDTKSTVAEDTVSDKQFFISGYPIAFFLPETRWGFGGGGIARFYPGKEKSQNPSVLQMVAAYTLNKQILAYSSYQLFLRKNRTEVFGELGYYDYFFLYYGVGNKTNFSDQESFFVRFPRVHFNYLERIKGKFRAGILARFDAFDITETQVSGILESNNTTGIEGGAVTNVGLQFRYDSRDFAYQPSKGLYATAEVSVSGKGTVSDYAYREASLNASYYLPLRKNHVLASNLFVGAQSGDPPFYKLFFIGGPKKNRGTIEGRFRDKNIFLLQTEYRFPIIWRFAGVAFASAGQVSNQFSGLLDTGYHYNYGAGFRFLLDRESKLRIRIDVGFGSDEPAFYFTVGEAF